jgi:diguanylate cyclase (GGDEF)-like protein
MIMEVHLDAEAESLWPLLDRSFDGVVLLAPAPWQVTHANSAAAECFATTKQALAGRRAVELFDDHSRTAVMELVQRAWVGDDAAASVTATVAKDGGHTQTVELRAAALALNGERLVGLVFRSVVAASEGTHGSKRLDPLTHLYDRDFLDARLQTSLRADEESARQLTILFVDLDNFKAVNDRFGHLVGDRVLREAARRLAEAVGEHLVARYGGDEFVVMIEDASSGKAADEMAARIQAAIRPPIQIDEGTVTLSASVGLARTSEKIVTPDELIAAADRAMYAAKRTGK